MNKYPYLAERRLNTFFLLLFLCQNMFSRIICIMIQKQRSWIWEEVMISMNRAQEEVASTCCTDKSGGFNIAGCNINTTYMIILIVVVIFCCCCGKGIYGAAPYPVKGGKCCGPAVGGRGILGHSWILILLVVLLAFPGGIGGAGLLGAGNVNTNIVNVHPDDGYVEDDCGLC
jgi:hypothetical protein